METRNMKSPAATTTDVESRPQPLQPRVAGPELEFDLSREIEQLRTRESWGCMPGRSSLTLVRQRDLRVILISMKANQRMGEHRADGRIAIQTIAGRICVHLQSRKIDLSAGRFLALQCGQHHDVESLEESAFLLIITWPAEDATGSALPDHSPRETFPGLSRRFR
jgi:quercetin dioxygenase-like cupin family protein